MSRFTQIEPILGKNPDEVNISNSEVQTFKTCRRRWFLGTYLGLQEKEEKVKGPLPLGTRIHGALESFYNDGEHPVDAYGRLLRQDTLKFKSTPDADDPAEVKKFESEAELGRIIMEGYYEWINDEDMDSDIEFVSQESQLKYKFEHDPRVNIIAKIDSRIRRRSDGSKAVLDFKTAAASNFESYLKYAQMSEQFRHYNLLEILTEPEEKVDGGRYRVLKKVKRTAAAKPPFYMDVDVRFNKKDTESFWIRLTGTIRDIMRVRDELDAGEDDRFVAYPTQKMDWVCGTCPFFQVCTMMDDGSDYEGYLTEMFVQVDPNDRYNDDKKEVAGG